MKELAIEPEQGQMSAQETSELSADVGASQESKSSEKGKEKEEKDKEKPKDKEDKEKEKTRDSDKEKGKEKDLERKREHEKEVVKGSEGTTLDALLQRLPGCVSRDLIDQLTVSKILQYKQFCVYIFYRIDAKISCKHSVFYRWSFVI